MQFVSQTPPMVATESATVVTELPKVETYWQPLATLSQQLETQSQLISDAGDGGNAWQLFSNSLKKVAKRWQSLTMMATYWQRTGDHWRRRAMWWQFPRNLQVPPCCQHVANTFSASVKGADRLATKR